MNGHTEEDVSASCEHVFDQFVTAVTCKAILTSFNHLLDLTGLRHVNHAHFYEKLKAKLKGSWKAQNLWAKLDKRASHSDYKKGQACSNHSVLIIGAGPCGLRTAIECALLGAKTVILEKRDRFSRNNVLHLWPFLITDLKNLGAKKFFGKFCAGAIDHISIRQLQCILLKVALLLGVEVHVNVSFDGLIEPPEDESLGVGWKCKVTPDNHAASEYEFDVLFGADGKRNTLSGFKRKEFRGKLAIAVTANFINRNSQAEARVQEISGVAFIFNQKFFTDLKERTRIDLENIVYYKDDTHYFVMTAKKASLLEKGVLKEDHSDTVALLDRANVDQERLMAFAREAANFSTNYQLPSLDYAVNHYGQADVAMFDFTSMFAAENASRFILKNGHHLLMGLVGDSLLEPFWPTGSGCARGFLSAFDAAWMMRNWALGKTPLQVLAERESIYTVLSQTTPNYLNKKHILFSIDPNTRYSNLNVKVVKPVQVRHLYEGGVFDSKELEEEDLGMTVPAKRPRNAEISGIDSYSLLRWCQRVLNTGKYRDVHVVDFTSSWRSGLALCALINSFRPDLINDIVLMECDVTLNNNLAFSTAEKELGIPPVLTGEDMAKYEVPDKLTMVSYLAQFYDLFKHEPLPSTMPLPVKAKRKSLPKDVSQPKAPHSPSKRTSIFQKLSAKLAKSKKRKEQEENERSILGSKKLKEKEEKGEVELTRYSKLPMEEIANRFQLDRKTGIKVSKTEEMSGAVSVTAMADLLVAKFKSHESKPAPEPIRKLRGQPSLLAATPASEFCSYCHKRVYIMERMSAEGEFFHRGCLKCDFCGVGLRVTSYTCDRDAKPVKFYCYRHTVPEQRVRPQRKRGLEEAVTENLPDLVITPPADVDTGQAPKEKTPRKAVSPHLTPLSLPKDGIDMAENTPERIEFEISFDGQEEESEEEQFEHNLRASLSSDTLLDDEDSDSELSDSDIESGAEDEVWENAVESLKSPRTPLTLEQACELHGNWKRQHSHENLADGVEDDRVSSRGPEYSRLLTENGEEEESSTEVEEDSEYETDNSSAEDDSDEDKTEPAQGASAEDHLEVSLNSPSPVSRLSASKASFFSEPPKVVSLDPWSMFGMGKKPTEKDMEVTQNVAEEVKLARKKSSSSNKKKSSASESKSSASEKKKSSDSKKDMSSKDTDASIESLELDMKSGDLIVCKSEHMSPAGSLDELNEEFILDAMEEGQHAQSMDNAEVVAVIEEDVQQHSSVNKSEEQLEGNHPDQEIGKEMEKEMESGDKLMKNVNGDEDDDDEILKKAALSHNMEQLLQEVDNRRLSKGLTPDQLLTETSESDENEMLQEGRLSPNSKKNRKPYVKCRTRHIKKLQKFHSTNSDSEAGRTDPTSTDNSQQDSSGSQSLSLDSAEDLLQYEQASDKSQNNCLSLRNSPTPGSVHELCPQTSLNDLEMDSPLTVGTEAGDDDDCLQQALENVAAMPDLSDNSDIDDLVLNNVDERFVTERRRKPSKKSSSNIQREVNKKLNKSVSDFGQQEKKLLSENKSVSSDTESSDGLAEEDSFLGEILDFEPGDEDIKPDQDLLKDYTTTLRLALGESYSDDQEEKCVEEEEPVDISGQKHGSKSDKATLPGTEHKDYTANSKLALAESYSSEMEEKYLRDEESVDISEQKHGSKSYKETLPNVEHEDYTTNSKLALAESYSSEMEEKYLRDEESVDISEQKHGSKSYKETLPNVEHEDYTTNSKLAIAESYSSEMEEKYLRDEEPVDTSEQKHGSKSDKKIVPSAEHADYTTNSKLALAESYSSELEEKYPRDEEPVDVSEQKHGSKSDKETLPDAEHEDYTANPKLALSESYSSEMEEKYLRDEESVSEHKSVSKSDKDNLPDAALEDVSNINRSEQTSIAEDTETTADNSSLYITPNASLETHNLSATESSNPASISTSLPLPCPNVPSPVSGEPAAETLLINEATSSNTHISLSDHPSLKQDNRDSTGSDIFLTPAEIPPVAPFVNKTTLSNQPQATPLPQPCEEESSQLKESTLNKDLAHKSPTLNKDLAHKSPKLLPLSSNHVPPPAKISPNSSTGSSQRKMPQLPKLNIPKRELTITDITTDQPIMCSSPKLGSKHILRPSTSNLKDNHALPTAGNSNTILKSQPTNVDSTTNKPAPIASKKDSFAKPASPPQKTKVPIDKSKLRLGSSSDRHDSDHEMEAKKKISAEGIVINQTFDDDIPFADESEAEERFYTPSAPFKKGKPTFTSSDHVDARKKIVPGQHALQDPDVSAKKTKSGIEKPKIQPDRKEATKTADKHDVYLSSTAPVVKRQPSGQPVDSLARLSASFDTNSASDAFSDKEDNCVQSATSSAAEGGHKSQSSIRKGKKSRAKTNKTKKQKETSDNTPVKQDENMKTPTGRLMSTESHDGSASSSSNITPKGSNDNSSSKSVDRILNTNRTPDKKTRTLKVRSGLFEDLEKTPTSEGKRDLAICSVFHSEVSQRPSRVLHGIKSSRKSLSLVPKASADEMSDSDESHISLSTMQRRRDEDLDDRVARRLRKIQQKQHKRAEQKRLRMAQEIQRQLEEVEVRQRELEERGIAVEKALRGDAPADDDVDESQLMSEWFSLVHEKNALLRYESELIVRAKELELEDRQARLETDFRERSKQPAKSGGPDLRQRMKGTKTDTDIAVEGHILDELLSVVEQRNSLVAMLEEDRLREEKEDSDLKEVMAQKGFLLSPLSFDTRRKKIEAPLATYAL